MTDGLRQRRTKPSEKKQTDYYEEEEGMSWKAKALGLLVLSSTVLGGATMLFMGLSDLFFPEKPERVSRDKFQSIVASGEPAIVICQHTSIQNPASKQVYTAGRESGVRALSLDCSAKTSSGDRTLYEGLQLQSQWEPAWFTIGMGRKPFQLSPMISEKEMIAQGKQLYRNRLLNVDTKVLLERCLRERSGGCLLAYSSLPSAFFEDGFESVKESRLTTQFGTLNSSKRVLRFRGDNSVSEAFQSAVDQAISSAKEANAGAQGSKGKSKDEEVRGVVYVAGRRLPSSLMDGDSGYYLFTFEASRAARASGARGISKSRVSRALDNVENSLAELRKLTEKYEEEYETWVNENSEVSKEEADEWALQRVYEMEEAKDAILKKYEVHIVHGSELQVDFRSAKKPKANAPQRRKREETLKKEEDTNAAEPQTAEKETTAADDNDARVENERVETVMSADEYDDSEYANDPELYEEVLDLDEDDDYE